MVSTVISMDRSRHIRPNHLGGLGSEYPRYGVCENSQEHQPVLPVRLVVLVACDVAARGFVWAGLVHGLPAGTGDGTWK